MKRKTILSILAVGLFLVFSTGGWLLADPIITYETTYLGGSTWQYDYHLFYGTFTPLSIEQGIAIFFVSDLYGILQDKTPSLADWHTYVLQKAIIWGVSVSGEFDAEALTDHPTIPIAFSVGFEWLGSLGAEPGSQPFTIYDNNFTILSSGYTSRAGVPEPATALLLGWGLGALVLWRKRA